MTKFVNRRFSVSGGKKYMDNWERVFRSNGPPPGASVNFGPIVEDKDEQEVPAVQGGDEGGVPGAEHEPG